MSSVAAPIMLVAPTTPASAGPIVSAPTNHLVTLIRIAKSMRKIGCRPYLGSQMKIL